MWYVFRTLSFSVFNIPNKNLKVFRLVTLSTSCFSADTSKNKKICHIQTKEDPNLKNISIVKVLTLGLLLRAYSMAWRSVGANNADLIRQLRDYGVIATDSVASAMIATDRSHYCPRNPYMDAPQPIGGGVTISAPHMHAFALEYLRDQLKPGARVLDVGSGSGYLTACFYRYIMAKGNNPNTRVVGIEHQSSLVALSKANLNADDRNMLDSGVMHIVEGDGRKGHPDHAPYDAIHVGAAAPTEPVELIKQLAKGGRLIVPVGPEGGSQYMQQYDKDANGKVEMTRLMGVMYVPLTDLRS